ncbi:MAG: PAS domain-containing protein, partial [Acetobacteraceae bacterium]|nr:PAS domain-containing protein [Acetobacteraceae bacterium]
AIVNAAEDGRRCAFYIADDKGSRLSHVVGMGEAYARAVDGFEISPETLACGLAVAQGKRVVTRDVLEDPRWQPWCWLAREYGYRGCWSFPVETSAGTLVGSFAMYFSEPRDAYPRDLELAATMTRTAAIIISRHKENEERVRSEERLSQFGEASQDLLWIRRAETLQWVYLTPAFETIYGLSREEALSGDNFRSWLDLIVPEDREKADAAIARVRDGHYVSFDYRIQRPRDGAIRWLRNTDFPIRDETGEVALIGGIGHDLTEFRQTELRFRALMEGIPQLIWRAIGHGHWTWSSLQWNDYTGQTEPDSHGWGWLGMIHPDDRESARDAWSHAIGTGGFELECRIFRRQACDYRWFQTRATPVRDEAGAIIEWLGTSTDIHELRKLQARQGVLVAELQHRTRNLMAVVQALAVKTAGASADLRDFRDRFEDRLEALARVQGLLSRLDEHDRVTFDDLIESELSAVDGSAEHAVTLSGPSGVRLRSSTVQTLAMALHELATNAVKYGALGQPKGRLVVNWSVEPSETDGDPWLHIEWRESGIEIPAASEMTAGSGHGRELIERALPYQLSARTSYTLGPEGVHCRIAIPVAASVPEYEGSD